MDALLGTGLTGSVRAELAPGDSRHQRRAAARCSRSTCPRDSTPIPARCAGEAVRAEATVTFVGLKTGLFVGDGPEFAGTVFFDDLELAAPAPAAVRSRV